jgi:hypothetical protein
MEVTGSGQCPVASCGTRDVQILGSAARELHTSSEEEIFRWKLKAVPSSSRM